MCGINGLMSISGKAIPEAEALVDRMNRALAHRGPDDAGIHLDRDRRICLGHRRLSIIDLSGRGRQPMTIPEGPSIVFNGEIYNFRELKAGMGGGFASGTDTEVLLRLYRDMGPGCLDRLRGMFAFAVWDPAARRLFLARDRVGIKPLYYTAANGVFAFSSEIRALLTLPWARAELDEEALYDFLTFNRVTAPRTMFRGIRKLHPGHRMVVGEGGIESCERYWEVTYEDLEPNNERDLGDRVFDTLSRAVSERMVSDVPVGAFLSGGVDSSAVVGLMSGHSAGKIRTYSIGFEGRPDYDELPWARKVSDLFGTEHFERIVTEEDLRAFLPRIAEIYDEPLADATSIPMHFISELARQNGTPVILTGDGSDELFCGYLRWASYLRLYPYYRAWCRLPSAFRALAASAYGLADRGSAAHEILSRAAAGREFFWGGAGGFRESAKHRFLDPSFMKRVAGADSHAVVEGVRREWEGIPKGGRPVSDADWMSFFGLREIVPNFYLHRADRLGMANSVEIRVPFLDHDLVSLALSVEGRWKLRNGEPKYILKKALERLLPTEILTRKKKGFCVPLREWIDGAILDYIDANLKKFCSETGIFSERGLRGQVEVSRRGGKGFAFTLWNVYFLMSWFRRWIL